MILVANEKVAQVDDRDMAGFLNLFRMNGEPVGDERLLEWLVDPNDQARLTIVTASRRVPVNVSPARTSPRISALYANRSRRLPEKVTLRTTRRPLQRSPLDVICAAN